MECKLHDRVYVSCLTFAGRMTTERLEQGVQKVFGCINQSHHYLFMHCLQKEIRKEKTIAGLQNLQKMRK